MLVAWISLHSVDEATCRGADAPHAGNHGIPWICNLYSVTKGQAAIREFARAMRDTTGNLPPFPAIFPDQLAPVVHLARDGVRELTMMRWGFPPPPKLGNRPVTNIRT